MITDSPASSVLSSQPVGKTGASSALTATSTISQDEAGSGAARVGRLATTMTSAPRPIINADTVLIVAIGHFSQDEKYERSLSVTT